MVTAGHSAWQRAVEGQCARGVWDLERSGCLAGFVSSRKMGTLPACAFRAVERQGEGQPELVGPRHSASSGVACSMTERADIQGVKPSAQDSPSPLERPAAGSGTLAQLVTRVPCAVGLAAAPGWHPAFFQGLPESQSSSCLTLSQRSRQLPALGWPRGSRLHVSQEGWSIWGRPEPPDLEGSSVRQNCFTAPTAQMRTLRPRGGDLPWSRPRGCLSIIRVAELLRQGPAPTQASPRSPPSSCSLCPALIQDPGPAGGLTLA